MATFFVLFEITIRAIKIFPVTLMIDERIKVLNMRMKWMFNIVERQLIFHWAHSPPLD